MSSATALLSYALTEQYLLAQRERTAVNAVYVDASIVAAGLAADNTDATGSCTPRKSTSPIPPT